MVNNCVVHGCVGTKPGENISLHEFPLEKRRRWQWQKFVQTTRALWLPTKYSQICSRHFLQTDFKNWTRYQMKYAKRLIVSNTAIPSIFPESPRCSWAPAPASAPAPAPRAGPAGGTATSGASAGAKHHVQRDLARLPPVKEDSSRLDKVSVKTESTDASLDYSNQENPDQITVKEELVCKEEELVADFTGEVKNEQDPCADICKDQAVEPLTVLSFEIPHIKPDTWGIFQPKADLVEELLNS